MKKQTFHFDLTAHEKAEMAQLSAQLFGGAKFKVFTAEEEASKEYKRYNYLVSRRLRYLSETGTNLNSFTNL